MINHSRSIRSSTMVHRGYLTSGKSQRNTKKLFQRSSSCNIHVHPRGQQNSALSRAPGKALNLARQIVAGHPQVHLEKGSGKLEKAGVIGSNISTALQVVHEVGLSGVKTVKAAFKQHTGSREVPNHDFVETYQSLHAIAAVTGTLSFIQDSVSGTWQAIKDIRHHSKRKQTQTLLQLYNPHTRKLIGHPSHQKALKERIATKVSDLSRSRSQVAVDHLVRAKDLLAKGVSVIESSLLFAEDFSKAAAQATPVVGTVSSAIATVHFAIKTGTQIVALNNLAKAKAATNDPLLKALAGHIKQERTIQARKHLINTAVGAAFTGVSIGLMASGAGAPAALIAAGALGTATGLGTMAFDLYHSRKLAKAREGSEALLAAKDSLDGLAKDNIGVAEKCFLLRLRTAEGKALNDSIEFLRNFGVTDNTIKKLQLAPEKVAMKSLQNILYQDKVKFKGLQLKQTGKTLLYIVGLTALGKRIKSGSLWLAGKLRPKRHQQGTIPAGHSLTFDTGKVKGSRQSEIKPHHAKLRLRPAYATVPNHFRYGRILS
ncbi:hypothetical protein GZ77_16935 [Endozoicomonas montiporae]|uniref:Uncharacterized protein n=2 Tax=Endozoicomonas montiporae TaxID=1027273 RepID=A0A081N657_9GAMM|nr:hypothetical protein [Endozoicomonas montiporae]AMO57147.1 hypothetical protein EZMO1_3141 [Endozoicomonas montiporae CL-33]KEQ13930.1 hypothetical protein GZ77_16935 [Endozoicomonas montiporae]